MMLKWRCRRGVIAALPPPGGPMADMKYMSSILLNGFSFDLRSYHPLWSIYCLRSSRGGYAPYSSFFGILRSSTKTVYFLPTGGPKTPLRRLSNFSSR